MSTAPATAPPHIVNIVIREPMRPTMTEAVTAPTTPPFLPEFLRNYQRRGVEWMHHLCETGCHGLLADEMGLGKTVQLLALEATERGLTESATHPDGIPDSRG